MKIEKACSIFNKLAFVWSGVDANDIKPKITAILKQAIAAAGSQNKFSPNPISQVGIEFSDMSVEIHLDGNDGRDIDVTDFFVNTTNQEILQKYSNFPLQLKEYFQKYWEILPKKHDNEDIKYDKFTTVVVFP